MARYEVVWACGTIRCGDPKAKWAKEDMEATECSRCTRLGVLCHKVSVTIIGEEEKERNDPEDQPEAPA